MKKAFLIVMILNSFLFFAQRIENKCALQIETDITDISNLGNIMVKVKNTGLKKVKINKTYRPFNIQLSNIKFYNEASKEYETIKSNFADINFGVKHKTNVLKSNEIKTFIVNVKETYQGKKLLNPNHKYVFDLRIDFYNFTQNNCHLSGNQILKDVEFKY